MFTTLSANKAYTLLPGVKHIINEVGQDCTTCENLDDDISSLNFLKARAVSFRIGYLQVAVIVKFESTITAENAVEVASNYLEIIGWASREALNDSQIKVA